MSILATNKDIQAMETLSSLSLAELRDLKWRVIEQIEIKEKEDELQEVLQKISENGYHCSITEFSDPSLKFLQLPLKIDLHSYDREDQSDVKVTGDLSDYQLPAFDRLVFDYTPQQDDPWELSNEDWEAGDWDDPITNIGIVQMYVYYRQIPCPPEGTHFDSINKEGGIDEMEIKGGKIYCFGMILADVSEWDEYDIFVLPYE